MKRRHTSQLQVEAARQGRSAAMHWLRVLCVSSRNGAAGESLKLAVACGDLNMTRLLRSGLRLASLDWRTIVYAAPHLDCLACLLQQGPALTHWQLNTILSQALRGMAADGHLNAMIYIHIHVRPMSKYPNAGLMTIAAEHGHLPMVQWLRSLDPPDKEWPLGLCIVAARSGNVALLQWLRKQDPPCPCLITASCTAAAAARGHLATLQWLHAQEPPCELSPVCTTEAAKAGRMDMLKWLRTQQPPCPWYVGCQEILSCTWIAADRQDLAMLQWLHAQKCPWDARCSLRAVERGNIPMLQWLLAQDPPCLLSSDSMAAAACKGQLPSMQHLHDMGWSLNGSLYYFAAEANAPDVLQWLRKQHVPAPACYLDKAGYGYRTGGLKVKDHMLMFLGDIGAPLPAILGKKATTYALSLRRARRAFCTFHGLLRWSRCAVADPSLDIDRAFNRLSTSIVGEHLLIRLSMLPQELISKIATMAELQHGVELL